MRIKLLTDNNLKGCLIEEHGFSALSAGCIY